MPDLRVTTAGRWDTAPSLSSSRGGFHHREQRTDVSHGDGGRAQARARPEDGQQRTRAQARRRARRGVRDHRSRPPMRSTPREASSAGGDRETASALDHLARADGGVVVADFGWQAAAQRTTAPDELHSPGAEDVTSAWDPLR